jgi:CheY-like chemotaxis protein
VAIVDFFKVGQAHPQQPDRERCLRDPEQILAWLEELARIRTPMDLVFSEAEAVPVSGKTELVGEETRTCTFSLLRPPAREPSPGQRVQLMFPMDGQRFQTELVYQDRAGYLTYRFGLPTVIRHAERRDSRRAVFRSRDRFEVVVLQSLFEGLGLSGDLVDLSMNGCCFMIHRAIRIQDERRMPIHPNLLCPGTPLALVRLPDLTHLPMVECGGHVSHMRKTSRGVTMGIAFENVGSLENNILGQFLVGRIPGFHLGFPRKVRYRDLTEAERAAPQPANDELELEPSSEELQTDPEGELEDALNDQNRLAKLHKRGKKILLVMGDELDRTMLMTILHQDGYRCLFEAKSLIQALDHHRRMAVDLLVLDQVVGHMGALQVVEELRNQGLPRKTPTVVIQRQPDMRLTVAAKAGAVSLLVERPLDFEGGLKAAMEGLLGL